MKLIRVLAVDDDPDFQYLLEQTVGSQPDMELVAVCSDGSQAFQAVQRHCPDIVLMDDQPSKIAEAIRLARRTIRIARENIWFAIGVKVAILILASVCAYSAAMGKVLSVDASSTIINSSFLCVCSKTERIACPIVFSALNAGITTEISCSAYNVFSTLPRPFMRKNQYRCFCNTIQIKQHRLIIYVLHIV